MRKNEKTLRRSVCGFTERLFEECSGLESIKAPLNWTFNSYLPTENKDDMWYGTEVYDLKPAGNTTRAQLTAILERFCVENKIIKHNM